MCSGGGGWCVVVGRGGVRRGDRWWVIGTPGLRGEGEVDSG